MTYHALLEYVRKAKDCGASEQDIRSRLSGAGWYRVDIDDAFDLYRRLTQPIDRQACVEAPAPKPGFWERIAPHHYDPRLIAVAVVSFGLGFLLYLWIAG